MIDGPHSDGRKEPRADAVLRVDYPDVSEFLQDYTVNISHGGTMIRVSRSLREGDAVELIISFPGLLEPLRMTGVVRWIQDEGVSEVTAGVEFAEQSDQERARLDMLVNRIKAGDRAVLSRVVRILVVEDNLHMARLITEGLANYLKRNKGAIAFETRHAPNGKEALQRLAEEPYDVILLDMYLPVMDGENLIRAVRRRSAWRQVPIIALGAGGDESRERAIIAGADFFLDKPVRLSDVLMTLERLLNSQLLEEGDGRVQPSR